MRLSMWMLADRLKKYDPVPIITEGAQVLRSARILSQDASIEKQNVYIAGADEIINGEADKLVCVHGKDLILLNCLDKDEVLNDIFDVFDFYNAWADDISERIRQGCSIQELVDASYVMFGQPLLIYDTGNEIIGLSSEFPRGSLDKEWDYVLENRTNSLEFLMGIQETLKEQRGLHQIHRFNIPGTPYSSVYRSLFHNRSWVGRVILLESRHSLSQGELQLFDYFCDMLQRWMSDSDKAQMMREESAVFLDLIERRPVSREEIDHKLHIAGWKKEDEKLLIRIEIPLADSELARTIFLRLEKLLPDSYVIYSSSALFILANLSQTSLKELEDILTPVLIQGKLWAVASYPFTDVYALASFHEQCTLTARYVPRREGVLYLCRDYALECIRSIVSSSVPQVLRHPAISTLKDYDQKNNSALYDTLYLYLRSGCNIAQSARELHLHRNSLLYRLHQIRDLTSIDPDDPDTREYLLFSYYI